MQKSHKLAEYMSTLERWPNFFFSLACKMESPGEFAKISVSLWMFLGKYPESLFRKRGVPVTYSGIVDSQLDTWKCTLLPSPVAPPCRPLGLCSSFSDSLNSLPSSRPLHLLFLENYLSGSSSSASKG